MTAPASILHPADNVRRGILLMVAATGLWTVHDAAAKWLAQDYSILQILLIRSLFSFVPIIVFVHREGGWARLATPRLPVLLGRGCLGFVSFTLYLAALPLMPLPDLFAVVMSAPLFITALSQPLLGERVGRRRWVAVLAGFAAVLFMIRPGGGFMLAAAAMVLASNLFYALNMMMTRRLGRTESAATLSFYASAVFLAGGAIAAPWVWIAPTLGDFVFMAATGVLAGLAQYTMTQAFRVAPPATVAPFEYCSMVWATILGFLVWRDLPGWTVVAGAAIIVASGLTMLRAETRG